MTMPISELDTLAPTPLQHHLQQCQFAAGHLHALHCASESIKAFIAPRLITLLVVMAGLTAVLVSLRFGSP